MLFKKKDFVTEIHNNNNDDDDYHWCKWRKKERIFEDYYDDNNGDYDDNDNPDARVTRVGVSVFSWISLLNIHHFEYDNDDPLKKKVYPKLRFACMICVCVFCLFGTHNTGSHDPKANIIIIIFVVGWMSFWKKMSLFFFFSSSLIVSFSIIIHLLFAVCCLL